MKIVLSNDFLFHGQEEAPSVLHMELLSLLAIAINEATGVEPVLITHCENNAGERFSRTRFFELSGITDIASSYYLYDMASIKDASWDYFKSFFDSETVFVASEFGMDLREKLTEFGITYLNFWFHPYKLLNDVFFLVGSNSPDIYRKLELYKVPQARLRFYCEYYSHLAERRRFLDNLPIEDNCCVFAGQTYQDKSVSTGTKYLNITDYSEKVSELARTYSKVYYVPHPSAGANSDVDSFLASTPDVEVLENVPTYYLLASPKVKKVVALSSSVLYEAHYFGKETEYLFKPLFKIDEDFSLNSFISIYQDYFAPEFWQDVLGTERKGRSNAPAKTPTGSLLAPNAEMFRDLLGLPFGYKYFGRTERMEVRLRDLESMGAHIRNLEGMEIRLRNLENNELARVSNWTSMEEALKVLDARTTAFDTAIHALDERTLAFDEAINGLTRRTATLNSQIQAIAKVEATVGQLQSQIAALSAQIEKIAGNFIIRRLVGSSTVSQK